MVDELEIEKENIRLINITTGEVVSKNNYTLNVAGQSVTASINSNYMLQDSFYGNEYRLEIPTTIKKGADLNKYITKNGNVDVPNKATVTVDNEPKATNEVFVTPVVVTPMPEKSVSDMDEKEVNHAILSDYKEEHVWNVDQKIKTLDELYQIKYKELIFIDEIVEELEVDRNGIKLLNLTTNKEVDKNLYTIELQGQLVVVKLSKELLEQDSFYGNTYRLEIPTTIKKGADLKKYVVNDRIEIPNIAKVVIDGKEQVTNKTKVTPTKKQLPKTSAVKTNEIEKNNNATILSGIIALLGSIFFLRKKAK